MTRTMLENIVTFMLEGHTYKEAAEEWGCTPHCIQRNINERYKFIDARRFTLLKHKPYMVFQRVIYTGCSLQEALKVWHVSQKRFSEFMNSLYTNNPRGYIYMRAKLEARKNK